MNGQLDDLVKPVVEAMGCELWGIERIALGRHSTLRIYIDAERGVDIEDCAKVSRQVSSLLDVEDPIIGEYTLQVSSPGLDRRLFRPEHYVAYMGEQVRIKLKRPFEGMRKYTGQLRGIDGDEVVLQQEGVEILFPLEEIERANIVPGHRKGAESK